jgi:hypothetical protein
VISLTQPRTPGLQPRGGRQALPTPPIRFGTDNEVRKALAMIDFTFADRCCR